MPNWNKPPIRISHAELLRDSPESGYRSKCIKCKDGVLLIRRNLETGKLEADDCCIGCGQIYIYTDIDRLNSEGRNA